MKISNLQATLVGTLIALIGAGFKFYDITLPGYILIIIGILGIPSIFIWNKWKKRSVTPIELFKDECKDTNCWRNIDPGAVIVDDKVVAPGAMTSLKKIGGNDPSGAIQYFQSSLQRGIVFTGCVYRPSDYIGGPADRLGIEDRNGNGYGCGLRHEKDRFGLFIEKRKDGVFETNLSVKYIVWDLNPSLTDGWYQFSLSITKNNLIVLNIDFNNQRLGQLKANDAEYTKFDKIYIRGGHHYYISKLSIYSI